jgi:pimeloyl-ACP methyl ester carboxylesterase
VGETPGAGAGSRVGVEPFRIDVPDAQLADLHHRLERTRWPEAETVAGGDRPWSQGVPLAYLQDVVRYWRHEYDWRARESRLNAVPQFRTEIDGLRLHFVHLPSPEPDALPLLLTHGWPGSIVEFLSVLGPLTDPVGHGGRAEDAFSVVAPSLPGYGFSDKPTSPGWTVERIARAEAALMARLGYERYAAQGGDWGSMITASLGQQDPEHVIGIHLTMPVVRPQPGEEGQLTDAEQAALDDYARHRKVGTGYSRQQSTRPQTLGYALVDSPVGQCAWILEKFREWTDCREVPEDAVSRDDLLDNVMLYWLPGTGASSARLYWESFVRPRLDPVPVPTGCSIFPKEIMRFPRRWVQQRFPDLRYWHELPAGGHFAALERPADFVEELRSFFRLVRARGVPTEGKQPG